MHSSKTTHHKKKIKKIHTLIQQVVPQTPAACSNGFFQAARTPPRYRLLVPGWVFPTFVPVVFTPDLLRNTLSRKGGKKTSIQWVPATRLERSSAFMLFRSIIEHIILFKNTFFVFLTREDMFRRIRDIFSHPSLFMIDCLLILTLLWHLWSFV